MPEPLDTTAFELAFKGCFIARVQWGKRTGKPKKVWLCIENYWDSTMQSRAYRENRGNNNHNYDYTVHRAKQQWKRPKKRRGSEAFFTICLLLLLHAWVVVLSLFFCLPSYTQMLCVDSIFKALQGFMSKIIFLEHKRWRYELWLFCALGNY